MKFLYKLTILVFISTLFTTSCVDETKFPVGSIATIETFPVAPFVAFNVTTSTVLDVTDIDNAVFGGILSAPANNVANYDLNVRSIVNGQASDFAPLTSINSFPSDLQITAASIASALGVAVADFPPGTRFDFEATSTGTDGTVLSFDSLSGDLQVEAGQHQSYRYNTFISCPFILADALGTYLVTNSFFNNLPAGNTFEVVAGDGSGQIIMQNPHSSPDPDGVGYNIVVNVNSVGLATVPSKVDDVDQFILDTDVTGNPGFFDTHVEGGGFVFSCSGAIVLTLDYDLTRIADGGRFTFGTGAFTAQKQ